MPLPASPRPTAKVQEERWVELVLKEEEEGGRHVSPSGGASAAVAPATATVTLKEDKSAPSHDTGLTIRLRELLQETRLAAPVPQPPPSPAAGDATTAPLLVAPPAPSPRCLALDLHFTQLSRLPRFLSNGEGEVTLLHGSTTKGNSSDPRPGGGDDATTVLAQGSWRCLYLDCSLNRFRSIDKRLGSLVHLLGLDLSSNLLTTTDGWVAPPSLQALILSSNQLRDLRGLNHQGCCTRLTYLDLSFNHHMDMEGLQDTFTHMVNLRTLKLNKCGLGPQLDGLSCLHCLRSLEVAGNQVEDVRPLATLPSLESLDVCDNAIKDVPALAASLALFKKLSSISIKGNPVTQEPGYRYAIFDANRGITSVDHTRASETVLRLIDDAKRQAALHDSIHHITSEFQQRIEVEQQSMEHQMGGLRSREKELLDRFLAIKSVLQREMEESIAYAQRMDLLTASTKWDDAPSSGEPTLHPSPPEAMRYPLVNRHEVATKIVQEEEERLNAPPEVAGSRHGIIDSSSSSSMREVHAAEVCLDESGSKAIKGHTHTPSGPTPQGLDAVNTPLAQSDDMVNAPTPPTPAANGTPPPDEQPVQRSEQGSQSSKHLLSFFRLSPRKAASKSGGPP